MREGGLWPDLHLLDCLNAAVRQNAHATAIVDFNSETGKRTVLSYAELARRAVQIGAALKSLGVRRGDVVSFQLPNWWQFGALHLGCLHIGAISNPLMPILRERELEFMLSLAETRVLVVPQRFRGFDFPRMAESLQLTLPSLETVLVVGCGEDSSFEREIQEAATPSSPTLESPLSPNDVTLILYTSGTTGEPKGVMHTSNTLFSNLTRYAERLGLSHTDIILMASPLAHGTGFVYGMMLPIYLHCKVVLQDIWKPDVAAQIIDSEKVTYTMASTPFLADLTDQAAAGRPKAFQSLRLFHSAGAPIPRALVNRARQDLGAVILSGWGMTENCAATTTKPGDSDDKILNTDGCPMPGMELRILDEHDNPLSTGQGRLQVRGCSNFVGYLKRPHLYQTDNDGWFDTGDLARLDEDGYVRITGRTKDIIIRGGENIPVIEIEGVLFKHPQIREVAIVGIPDARLGERACAFIVPRQGAEITLEAVTNYLQQNKVTKQYWPEFLKVCDDLPKTPSGKVQKFRLRSIAKGGSTSGGNE